MITDCPDDLKIVESEAKPEHSKYTVKVIKVSILVQAFIFYTLCKQAAKGLVMLLLCAGSNTGLYKSTRATWVKVFRIIPQFRILRLTFHRKSASKC